MGFPNPFVARGLPQPLSTAASPTFAGLTVTGAVDLGSGAITLTPTSTNRITAGQLFLTGGIGPNALGWIAGTQIRQASDGFLSVYKADEATFVAFGVDAANTFALRNGTNAQTGLVYDTWASATDYHRLALKTARATLSNVTGASVTATGLIPEGAILVGLTSKVTTALGTSLGATGYTIGDGSDADRWGAVTGTALGTSSDNRDWTATTVQAFTAAQDVVVTATGGNFDATGVIYLSVQYLIGQAD